MDLDKFERFISNSFRNVGQGFYDSYVEANVRFRSKLGMKEVIVRRQLGNCCKWCADLAGIYDANNHPDDIYKRHRNCRCLVTHKTEKQYEDVWSGEKFKTQKEARYQRIKDITKEKFINEKYDEIKRKLLAEDIHIYDATDEWNDRATPKKVVIKELNKITIKDVEYEVDGKYVLFDLSPYEKEVLGNMVKNYGGVMELYPRITKPENIKTPDCRFNKVFFDLKTPGLNKPGTTSPNALFNTMFKKKEQSTRFIFDISLTGLNREQAIAQARALFFRDKSKFIETAVLYDKGDFFKVFERI